MKLNKKIKEDLKNYLIGRLIESKKSKASFRGDKKIKEESVKYLSKQFEETKKRVVIVSPYKLDIQEIHQIFDTLPFVKINEDKYENLVDQDILAGVIIKYGTKLIDLSVKSKLNNLRRKLYEDSRPVS